MVATCVGAAVALAQGSASRGVPPAPLVGLPPISCTRYAAVTGSDRGAGTAKHPYRTVTALVNSLKPGQTGCLLAGTYRENVSIRHGGTDGRPVTLAGAPGGLATVLGTFWVATGADHVVVRDLELDGRSASRLPSPQVNGNDATFFRVDVTDEHTGICFLLGGSPATYGVPHGTTIARSRIHDCGTLPPSHLEHGIYIAHAVETTIVDNDVYDNADWGLHLYPDAQSSNIQFNVFDGNGDGAIIAGTGDTASSDNTIARNIFSNSIDKGDGSAGSSSYGYNLTSYWSGRVGSGNLVAQNCFWHGANGNVYTSNGGFVLRDNRVGNPRYVDRPAKDFRVGRGSPCAGDGPRPR